MNRPAGYIIQPHVHDPVPREVHYTKEVLFIKSGKVRVDFYDDNQLYLKAEFLTKETSYCLPLEATILKCLNLRRLLRLSKVLMPVVPIRLALPEYHLRMLVLSIIIISNHYTP